MTLEKKYLQSFHDAELGGGALYGVYVHQNVCIKYQASRLFLAAPVVEYLETAGFYIFPPFLWLLTYFITLWLQNNFDLKVKKTTTMKGGDKLTILGLVLDKNVYKNASKFAIFLE